jgi:hypothetical protein
MLEILYQIIALVMAAVLIGVPLCGLMGFYDNPPCKKRKG